MSNYTSKFESFCRSIDKPKDEQIVETLVQPDGIDLYAVYKRSNKGYNRQAYFGLSSKEAIRKAAWLNQQELKKREADKSQAYELGVEYKPDEVILYDVVKQGSEEESPYWNPKPVILKARYE